MDGQIGQRLVSVGGVVHLNFGNAQNLVVLVEHGEDVLGRAGYHTINPHTGHHHHALSLFQDVIAHLPLGYFAMHIDGDGQRFRHAIVGVQRNKLLIRTYVNKRRDSETDFQIVESVDGAAGLRSGNPDGQVAQLEVLLLSTQVLHRHIEITTKAVGRCNVYLLPVPLQGVAVDIEIECHGVGHQVALQVGNLLDGDIDIGLLNREGRLVQVDEQFVVFCHVAVLQVLQLGTVRHRCIVSAVDEGIDDGLDKRVATLQYLALRVDVSLDANARRLKIHRVVVLMQRAFEVQVEHQ